MKGKLYAYTNQKSVVIGGIEYGETTLTDRILKLNTDIQHNYTDIPDELHLPHLISKNQRELIQKNLTLLEACKSGDFKAIDEALASGAHPSGEGYLGIPVIYSVCIEGSHKVAAYLIQKYPSCVLTRTNYGLTVLYAACNNKKADIKDTAELIHLILKNGTNINERIGNRSSWSILHESLNPLILKTLLEYKPDPFILNGSGMTPLEQHIAFGKPILANEERMKEYEDVLQILRDYENAFKKNRQTILQAPVDDNEKNKDVDAVIDVVGQAACLQAIRRARDIGNV